MTETITTADEWATALDAELGQLYHGIVSDQVGAAFAAGTACGVGIAYDADDREGRRFVSVDGRWEARFEQSAGWWTGRDLARLTVKITEEVTVAVDTDGADASTTHAVILDEDGEELDSFGGPVSEEWLPDAWDAALTRAGYRRLSDWDVPAGTAAVAAQ